MDTYGVRSGLAAAAATIPDLAQRCFVWLPDSVNPPVFYVGPVEIEYGRGLGVPQDIVTYICRLLVSQVDDRTAQQTLDAYLARTGSRSVKTAIERDRSLGGVCVDAFVAKIDGYGSYEHPTGVKYLGAQWHVRVSGRGD